MHLRVQFWRFNMKNWWEVKNENGNEEFTAVPERSQWQRRDNKGPPWTRKRKQKNKTNCWTKVKLNCCPGIGPSFHVLSQIKHTIRNRNFDWRIKAKFVDLLCMVLCPLSTICLQNFCLIACQCFVLQGFSSASSILFIIFSFFQLWVGSRFCFSLVFISCCFYADEIVENWYLLREKNCTRTYTVGIMSSERTEKIKTKKIR